MQNLSTPRPHGVPESFYSKFGPYVTAVLSGFDRIGFRATLRPLFSPNGPEVYLNHCKVLIKHFKGFAQGITALPAACYADVDQLTKMAA
jgi:hypothetical protein